MGWMGSGKAERYEIVIDTENRTISASDRVLDVQLWEDDFQPRLDSNLVYSGGYQWRSPINIPRWCTLKNLSNW